MGKLYEGAPAQVDDFHSSTPPRHTHEEQEQEQQQEQDQVYNNEQELIKIDWESVTGLDEQQKKSMGKLSTRGVHWKHPSGNVCKCALLFLFHGGDVQGDGNCLFTAAQKAMRMSPDTSSRELRRRTVRRFLHTYEAAARREKEEIDKAIKNLYTPDLGAGWGVHVVQELKLLAPKQDRPALDAAVHKLLHLGLLRETAAESIYKERCIAVENGLSWGKYMSICGSVDDEYDIITLQYTVEGLLTVDDNRQGRAAAFGDDIAIHTLASDFNREIFVVQAHGSDAMIEDDNCLFFLPHRPKGEICYPPVFLFMKGTGWCGAGADHYEPLLAYPAPVVSQEKAAVVL